MDIFSTPLSPSDLYLLGVAGALVLAFLQFRGPLTQSAIQRKADAVTAFNAPFVDVLLNLRENPSLPSAQIARLNYYPILSATQQFRPHIHVFRRRCFDKAIAQYKQACQAATEGDSVLAQFASEQGEYAQAKRKALDDAVQNLRSFARQP